MIRMGFAELFIAAGAAALATSLGATVVLLFRKISCGVHSALVAFSAGLMAFSATEMLTQSHKAGDFTLAVGFLAGVVVLYVAERMLPHLHFWVRKRKLASDKKKAALVAGAVTIHNVPEGLAIASAFAGSAPLGWLVAASIAIQDVPEGFLVSGPLTCYGMDSKRSVAYGILSGIVEFTAALAGFLFLSIASALTPFGLSFSAGAMLYVIFVELLPDAFRPGYERASAISLIAGVALAFILATALGF